MQTVDAQVILDGAAIAMEWDLTQIEPRQTQQQREAFSLALQEVWAAWWWEDLMTVVQAQFAPTFSSQVLVQPGNVVYWPTSDNYYQAYLITSTAPTDALGNLQPGWLETRNHLKPVKEFDVNATYLAGDLVNWRGQRYVNATGAQTVFAPDVDSLNWVPVPTFSFSWPFRNWDGTWTGPTGTVRAVSRHDPRRSVTRDQDFIQTPTGVTVLAAHGNVPFVWTRRPVPIVTGDPFDSTVDYTATPNWELCFP